MRPRSPFPLAWPDGQPRTPAADREASRFNTGFVKSRTRLLEELRMMGGHAILISSNLPVKRDGTPYASGGRGIDDPGVAVYWHTEGTRDDRVMACDRWIEAGDNLHAVALSIAAMRGLARWGGSNIVERAFAGFAQLGAGPPDAPPPEPELPPIEVVWRDVLGLAPQDDLEIARVRYKKLAMQFHPDRNGGASAVPMQRVIAAWKIATKELR